MYKRVIECAVVIMSVDSSYFKTRFFTLHEVYIRSFLETLFNFVKRSIEVKSQHRDKIPHQECYYGGHKFQSKHFAAINK